MTWTGSAQAFLDAGGSPRLFVAVWAEVRNRATGLPDPVGFWSGDEAVTIDVGGVARLYQPAGQALTCEPIRYRVGTVVQSTRLQMQGLTPESDRIVRGYDATQAPIDVLHVMFDAGNILQGTRRLVAGVIDDLNFEVDGESEAATLTVSIGSQMRGGTRVLRAKKSDASYRARGGDTAAEYASLKDVESDEWK